MDVDVGDVVENLICHNFWLDVGFFLYSPFLAFMIFFKVKGNAMHTVRMRCEVLNVSQYSDPTFGPF